MNENDADLNPGDQVVLTGTGWEIESRDPVNHPPHYTKYPVEVIELTRHMSFGRGNAVKYIARAGLKSKETELEDLRKALFYIQDEIAMLEGKA